MPDIIFESHDLYGYTFTYIEIALGAIFILAYLIRVFHNYLLARLALRKDQDESKDEYPSISVIVPARNSSENLRKLLPQLLTQNYPSFEVVVVNDCSVDETEDYLNLLQKSEPKLKVSFVRQETDFSNALVLTVGIRAASNEWLLFLDPSVELMSSSFLREYSHYLRKKVDVVYGYSNSNFKDSFWGRLCILETFMLFLNRFSAWTVGATMPVYGVNIAYRRDAFFEVKGFAGNLDERFAENELLSNALAKRGRVQLALRPTTITRNSEELNRYDWMNLKRNQLLMMRKFHGGQKLFLRSVEFSLVAFNLTFLYFMLFSSYRWFALALWILNLLMHTLWVGLFQKKIYEHNMMFQEPFYNQILPVVNFLFRVKLKITASRKKWR